MQKVAWSIEAIHDIAENTVPLTTALVATIEDKKQISRVVKLLAEKFPLDKEYLFLKRVKADKESAYIIVTIGTKSVKTEWENSIIEGIDPKKELLKIEIPTKQPQTRKQYEKSKQLWPCHFHEDKRLEAVLGKTLPEVWGDKAFETHCTNMQRVLNSNLFSAVTTADSAAEQINSCVSGLVWDPKRGQEIASAFDTRTAHDLRHCTMNLIDCVAHAHGGGAWPLLAFHVEEDTNDKAYLLNDYDVYLKKEPCIMCSMALVHSRVSRVFFAEPSPTNGGLYSVARLQTVTSLNHAFEVYKVGTNSKVDKD